MSPILLVSLLIRIAAVGSALVVARRVKDWRVGLIALVPALMAIRETLTILAAPAGWQVTAADAASQIPGLLVAAGVLLMVIFVGRLIMEKERAASDLAASNDDLRRQIKAREEAKVRLRESERMLTTLMGNLPGMVYRSINDRDWTMIFCSDGCRALTGYDPADFIGNKKLSYAQIIHPDDRDAAWRQIQDALDAGRPFEVTYRIRTANGAEKWAWEQGCAVPHTDGGVILEGFVTDITERKLFEDALRQAQKMEVVGQLTGGVAHDFNNLLSIIIGNLELAAESTDDGSENRTHIARALNAAERGATLTRHLLAFSRKQVLQPQLVELNKLVPRAIELFQRALGESIQVETVLAGGLWKTMVDPAQLEHALLNLAVNARDAMPSGGRLTIETANTRLDEEYRQLNRFVQPGPYVMLAVSDTGVGMDRKTAARAFEPFFTTKDVGKGSGLGLSMVYGFVKQSGGHVKIYSEPERGTTIKLYFPRAREQATPEIERPLSPPIAAGGTILVVEDDPDVRRLSGETLSELGYHVIEAGNGQVALQLLTAGSAIDMLFTDLVLPGGIDGIELAKQARALHPGIKVLFTTGYGYSAAQRNDGIRDDSEMLSKPYRKAELVRKVRDILGGVNIGGNEGLS